jgi:cold shock CspA family protein
VSAGPAQPGRGGRYRGKVEFFDRDVGLGELRTDDGELFPFHCTQLSDGSREIAVGARVELTVAPGHRGTWEAVAVAPLAVP